MVVLVGALLGISGVLVARSGGDDSAAPSEWDARVVDLVAFVEDERELPLDEAVPIDFLTEEEFVAEARGNAEAMAAAEQEAFDEAVGPLVALGLVPADLDLGEASGDLAAAGTLAWYDPIAERIVVRGTEVTVGLRATLVHELVHVAQDRAFDLQRVRGDGSSAAFEAFRMLVEGDANRIMHAYLDQLGPDEVAAYEAEMVELGGGGGPGDLPPGLDEVPGGMVAMFSAPYAFGDPLVEIVAADGGNAAVDAAFDDPPSTSEHGFDPRTYVAGDEAVEVPEPDVPDGADLLGDPSAGLGATGLFVVLAERIDTPTALAAADGWGGDAAISYRDGDDTCVLAHVTGDEGADTDEIAAALEAWVAAGPEGAATVSDRREGAAGRYVRFETCHDPGGDELPAPTGDSLTAMTYPVVRAYVTALAVRDGADPWSAFDVGTCVADAIPADLSGPDAEAQMRSAMEGCVDG